MRFKRHLPLSFLLLVSLCAASGVWAQIDFVRVSVGEQGLYRVTGEMLEVAGVPLEQVNPESIALSCGGKPVARHIIAADPAVMTSTDAVVFYGEPLDERWTDTSIYRLTWSGDDVIEMAPWNAGSPAPGGARTFPSTVRFEENKLYAYLIWAPDKDELRPWYWLAAQAKKEAVVEFDLPHLVAGEAEMRVLLRGRTSDLRVNPDHHVIARVNDTVIGDVFFDGQAEELITATLPDGTLRKSGNRLTLFLPGDTDAGDTDQVYLDWIEVTYLRTLHLDGPGLEVTLTEHEQGQAGELGVGDDIAEVYVLDLGDPLQPHLATVAVDGDSVRFALPQARPLKLWVQAVGRYREPAAVEGVQALDLRSTAHGADYIIIAHDTLVEAIQPLAEHRGRNMRVAVVPVSAVYDEFNHGVKSPHAIKEFLGWTYNQWQRPAPGFVLLVGDASYDPRGYTVQPSRDLIPCYPVRLDEGVETPTDIWYVCLEGDGRTANMAIGRFPAFTPDQVAVLIDKTLAYERQDVAEPWARRVLVVADHELDRDEASWFETSIEALWNYLLQFGYQPEAHYLRLTGINRNRTADENQQLVREAATPRIIEAWNNGTALVVYEGHGGALYWGRQRVLEADDVAKLTNTILPVTIDITCFSGQFDHPNLPDGQCLAEKLLLHETGGAAACITPTRLGGLQLHQELARLIAGGEERQLGRLLAQARNRYYPGPPDYWGRRDTYNLLGDPALELRIAAPQTPPEQELAQQQPEMQGQMEIEVTAEGRRRLVGPMPRGGAPDTNNNGIDDRLEKLVAERLEAGRGDEPLQVALRLNDAPSDALFDTLQRLGGRVEATATQPYAVLLWIPAHTALQLKEELGAIVGFVRWGAFEPM